MKCLLNKFSVSLLCVHLISQLAFARERDADREGG